MGLSLDIFVLGPYDLATMEETTTGRAIKILRVSSPNQSLKLFFLVSFQQQEPRQQYRSFFFFVDIIALPVAANTWFHKKGRQKNSNSFFASQLCVVYRWKSIIRAYPASHHLPSFPLSSSSSSSSSFSSSPSHHRRNNPFLCLCSFFCHLPLQYTLYVRRNIWETALCFPRRLQFRKSYIFFRNRSEFKQI